MKAKSLLAVAGFVLLLVQSAAPVRAHCPLCTAAVGAGVVAARFYGVDDTVVGVWVGAFVISTALWLNRVLKKEYLPFQGIILSLFALVATIVPFYFAGLIGNPDYRLFGMDKLLLGMIAGSAASGIGMSLSKEVKKRKGKVLFPFQTIAFIIASLSFASVAFWLVAG